VCDDWRCDDIRGCFQPGWGRADCPARTRKERFVQAADDGITGLGSMRYKRDTMNSRFLNLTGPFVAGVAKGPGWLEAAENASAKNHIFSFALRVFRTHAEQAKMRTINDYMHGPAHRLASFALRPV